MLKTKDKLKKGEFNNYSTILNCLTVYQLSSSKITLQSVSSAQHTLLKKQWLFIVKEYVFSLLSIRDYNYVMGHWWRRSFRPTQGTIFHWILEGAISSGNKSFCFIYFVLHFWFFFFFLHYKLDIFYICTDWYTMANLANLYIVQFGSSIISESIQKFTVNQIDVLVFFWWHRIFYYRVDIAVVNSSILMNQSKYPEKDNQ